MRVRLLALVLAVTSTMVACEQSTTAPVTSVATELEAVSGTAQSGVVGEPLANPLVVRVLDQEGQPMSGAEVVFVPGSGTVSEERVSTGSDGTAGVTWMLGREAGSQAAEAAVSGVGTATFTADAEPGPVHQVAVSPLAITFDALGDTASLSALARDQYDNIVPDAVFDWGSLDVEVAGVDGNGLVTATGDGATQIRAAAEGVAGLAQVSVSRTARSVSVEAGTDTLEAIDAATQLEATVRDASNAPIPGAGVSWLPRDPSVVRVDETGLATAVGPGATWVLGMSGAGSDSVELTVDQVATSVQVAVESDTLNAIGFVRSLAAAAWDANGYAIDEPFAWSTADNSVAGAVGDTAVAQGVGEVDLTASMDGASDTMVLVVRQVPATVVVSPQADTVDWRDTAFFAATAQDSNGVSIPAPDVVWGTGDEGIALTDPEGTAEAVGPGSTAVTASAGPAVASGELWVRAPADRAISAGDAHGCLLDPWGAVYCWGSGNHGQLGNGAFESFAEAPVPVMTDKRFVAIETGGAHTCGLTGTGAVWCWGFNGWLQLGDGTSQRRSTPVAVQTELRFEEMESGDDHVCGLTESGAAYCWGQNQYGQLGDGTNTTHSAPVAVLGDEVFTHLGGGRWHTCGVDDAGQAYCWGRGRRGQLGDGSRVEQRNVPVQVSGAASFVEIDGGREHTCALTAAGDAWCWGHNSAGNLGDGSTQLRTTPVAVSGGRTFTSISTGFDTTCGITDTGAFCWGSNGIGQVGDETPVNRTAPTAVSNGANLTAVDAGDDVVCGLDADGTPRCWGRNRLVGSGRTDDSPIPIAVSGGLAFDTVVGAHDFVCGLTPTGDAYCWGDNQQGQLGGATESFRATPVAVAGGLTFSSLTAGWDHACGLTTADQAYCWGANDWGQLGDGTRTDRSQPVAVSAAGSGAYSQIEAGRYHTCALDLADGVAFCWGLNNTGQLGVGSTGGGFTVPQEVCGAGSTCTPPAFDRISAGQYHTCAVRADPPVRGSAASVVCWGNNQYGQLGDGTTTTRPEPDSLTDLLTGLARDVTVGAWHSCAALNDGRVYCWGHNGFGQLGTGDFSSQTSPTRVSGLLSFSALSAGGSFNCGLADTGAYCWGVNSNGQLGHGSRVHQNEPAPVQTPEAFAGITGGTGSEACGMAAAGQAYCWGFRGHGQLGNGKTAFTGTATLLTGGIMGAH